MNNIITEKDKMIEQPEDLMIDLFDHQKSIIRGMIKRENDGYVLLSSNDPSLYLKFSFMSTRKITNTDTMYKILSNIGILSDRTGSGKTIMVLTLILLRQNPPMNEQITYGTPNISVVDMTEYINVKTNLIIVSPKIINYWISYMEYLPTLKYFICQNDKQVGELILESINQYNIIFVSSKKYNFFFEKFINVKWGRIIIDDADIITLDKSSKFNSHFMWLVSNFPNNLLNNKSLLSLMNGINTPIIESLMISNKNEYINKSMLIPICKKKFINCDDQNEQIVLNYSLQKQVLNELDNECVENAVKLLNCNADTKENICNKVTKSCSNSIIYLENKKLEIENENELNEINEINNKLKRYTDKLNSITKRIYSTLEEYCPICLGSFKNPILIECCNNIFCMECIIRNLMHKNLVCPFCKEDINIQKINLISSTVKNIIKMDNDKVSILLKLISEKGKYVIFIEDQTLYELITINFMIRDISYGTLVGTNKIKNTLNDFDNGKIKVLLLNKKNYGYGYYLEMATSLIIYNRGDLLFEEMIISRCNRYGRNESLNVYYLINKTESITGKSMFECEYSYE